MTIQRALITGITGQDGSYLTEQLQATGAQVHGLIQANDPLAPGLRALAPTAALHVGDLSDAASVAAVIDEVEPDAIFNLGGISSVAFSWAHPLPTGLITGLGAGAILEAAWQLQERLGRPVRVVQASSAEIFGAATTAPQNEQTPIAPTTPYGAAKAFAHHLVGVYRGRGLHATNCILYNHESPRRPETFVTRKITASAARIARGTQDSLQLGAFDVRRDWGWAPDYVDALARAAAHDEPGDYVIATGEAHSVRDFVAAAFTRAGITDWEPLVSIDPTFTRTGDAPEMVGDARHALDVLGWRPTVSFSELVGRMVDHDLTEHDLTERATGETA